MCSKYICKKYDLVEDYRNKFLLNFFKAFKKAYVKNKAILLLGLLLLFNNLGYAQKDHISFENLTVEQGLSQSSILSIAQDSMGFMWFGTKDGLNRYDSRSFEVFKNNEKDTTSLSSSLNINALLTDSKGNLWVGTQKGLNKYDPESNSFIRFMHNPKQKNSISHNTIRCLYEDRQGNIWIGTDSGLNKLINPNHFERFLTNTKGLGVHPTIKAIHQDTENTVWVGTQNGLLSLQYKNGSYRYKTYHHNDKNINSIAANDINTITEDLNHNLWIGTHFKGLDLFDRTSKTFKHFKAQPGNPNSLSSNVIRKIRVDRTGNLWIATLNGINVYDPVKQRFSIYQHNPENPSSLSQNSVYDIFQGNAGSVWVGTYYGGINVYHANAVPFKVYKHYSYKNSLSSNIISAIVEDNKNNLWIGTEAEGLNYYNRETGRFTTFKSNLSSGNSLSSNLIKAIVIDDNGDLWIAAYEGGLDFYSPKTGKFKNYKLDAANPNSLSANRVTTLLKDRKGRIWIGSRKGLYQYNQVEDNFIAFSNPYRKGGLPSKTINHLFLDGQQNIWVATDDGLFYYPNDAKSFRRLRVKYNPEILKKINCIQEDADGNLWFGSYNGGLLRYDRTNQEVFIYTKKNGLPSNNVTGILEDNDGVLWLSTDKGLAKFEAGLFKVYTRNDGLPGNVFNYHSLLKTKKGELFFGGYNGMVSFIPEEIKENKKAPKMVFTRLRLFNKAVSIKDKTGLLDKALSRTKEIIFNHEQNIFSVDFSALNYIKSRKNSYAYKLEGFEKDWNYVNIPTATFTNLPAGHYNLLIKGANNDGIWSESLGKLAIIVKPPFWLTWWAYIFYGLLLAGLLFMIIRFILIKALLKREHEVHQMKLDFFTNVSHEIRTPLTLILGPLEKIIEDTREQKSINNNLLGVAKNVKRLSKLINELMDFRKIESGKMRLNISEGDFVSFAKEIFLSFQHLAIQRKIQYSFKSTEEEIKLFFDKEQLEKVVFNLLSNAFKFVPDKGKISVQIIQDEDQLKFKVLDNGIGIPDSSKKKIFTDFYQAGNHQGRNAGTGIGLALSKNIAELHHGDLTLEENSKDTCFNLSLKLGSSHFNKVDLVELADHENPLVYHLQSEIDAMIYENSEHKPSHSYKEKPLLLVVDDNEEVRNFIVKTVGVFYWVKEANNGEQALLMATEEIPDLIISDVMMPIMDGFELCRMLKTDERTRHIPVILLTARSGEIHELDGLKTGADIYLTKPFSVQKLLLNIENLLALHENMRKRFSQQLILEPTNVTIESTDQEFLEKVLKLIDSNINNSAFNVNQFAAEIGMSTPVFYKKIKALTGLTVNNFVKSIRLKRAAQLLEQHAGTVYEIAYMVGFSDPKYFSREFRKQFGKIPSEY